MKKLDNEAYDFIGKLAIAVYPHDIKISLDALKQMLRDKGHKYSETENIGLGRSVAAAYRAWGKVDSIVRDAIALVYVGRDGEHSWIKYEE
jgi:hypothetical protein